MSELAGASLLIKVSATVGGAGTTMADGTRYSKRGGRPTTRTAVFGSAVPRSSKGTRDVTFTLTTLQNPTDPGQAILYTAEETNASVWIHVLPDGSNGFKQECTITSNNHDADPDTTQSTTFECTAVAARVAIGTGIPINV